MVAYDSAPERLALAVMQGVAAGASVADACSGAGVVFSMVFDDAALEQVVSGRGGVAQALASGALFVDMSTVSPAASARVAEALAARRIRYLRAPVSGSVPLAEAGTLTVLASGDQADFEALGPLLSCFSGARHYLGAGEAARVVKLAINLMVASSTALIGEALALGESQGVARDVLVDALNASIVGSRHYAARAASLKSRRYNRNGPVDLVAKDLALTLDLAHACGLRLAITEQVSAALGALHRQGHGGTEITILAEQVARTAAVHAE